MFRSDFDAYYKGIRKISDELCRENRLSVIETDGKGKSYAEWISGQTGKPTIRGMVRKDVEQAIVAADSFDGFILELQNMGYTVKYGPRVEHMAVRHKNAQRNVRIDWLDPRFSESALREYYRQLHRMPAEMQQEYRQENAPAKPQWQPTELQPTVRRARYRGKLPRRYSKVSGFMACYYHYCALLRKAYHGKATKRCYFLLREGKELKIIALQSKDVGQFKELAKQYGVLFAVIKDKAQNEKVDVMFKAEDVAKLNRIYEQLGYAIPKVTTADRKKDPTRRQSDSSLLTRGKNPLDIDPRPSVRATIMALKNAAKKAAQAQEKVQDITVKEER